jgi:outer membrane protein, heavy metal efflux system
VAVKIPLYFWRRQTPAFEQAVLEKGAAHARADAARLSLLAEAQNQWIAIQTTRRTAQIYADELIPQTRATLASALAAYRVGKVDFQTLVSAEIDLLELRRDYYRTIADNEIAVAKVEEIVGDLP